MPDHVSFVLVSLGKRTGPAKSRQTNDEIWGFIRQKMGTITHMRHIAFLLSARGFSNGSVRYLIANVTSNVNS